MRDIRKAGLEVKRFVCPFCGQEEVLTSDELPFCMNCGTPMDEVELDFKTPVKAKDPEPEMPFVATLTESPLPKKKGGRPPKRRPGTCSTCLRAMTTLGGYTCKEFMELKKGTDTCDRYKQGDPID